jgi:hypothetical protein
MMGGFISLGDCTRRHHEESKSCIEQHEKKYGPRTGQYELTAVEKDNVRTTWAKLAERPDEISLDIFLRIFELIPKAKEFFPFRDAAGEALVEHPYLKAHAMRFFNAVGMTVLNLDAWEVSI